MQTSYTYEPFGGTTQTGTASSNSFKYTGREDDGTGLLYYRARYYSPRLQRFISEDPIGFVGGDQNLYAYVEGNPVNFVDLDGLTKGEKQHIRPSHGDEIGDQIRDFERKRDTLSPVERDKIARELQRAIDNLTKGKRKDVLDAFLKTAKRNVKYICRIPFLAPILGELLDPPGAE